MKKKIIALGIEFFPDDEKNEFITCVDFNTHLSLADADIILISPTYYPQYDYSIFETYRGKTCLDENSSGRFLDDLSFWKKEVAKTMEEGKTIFLILNKPNEFFFKTGKQEHSGSGRNRQTTAFVDLFNSYEMVSPILSNAHFSAGSEITYKNKNPILSTLWEENKQYFHYQASFNPPDFKGDPFFYQKRGKSVLGGIVSSKYGGKVVCLPAIELEAPDFTYSKVDSDSGEEEEYWAEEAKLFTRRFAKAIIGIDNSLKSNSDLTPPPKWSMEEAYVLQSVIDIEDKVKKIQTTIEKQEIKKLSLKEQEQLEKIPTYLLYEKGKPLEIAVREALKVFGIKATSYLDNESEFDVVFSCEEGTFLGEVEGRDTSAIAVKKLSQLMRNLAEYLSKDDVTEPAKGILFGNGYRLTEPEKRECQFTEKCITGATQATIALVNTADLFPVVKYLKENSDTEFKKQCRKSLLNTTSGIVQFPDIPVTEKKD